MANFPVAENPEFTETMEQITTKDKGAPETFNPRYQYLLNNDNFLKKEIERAGSSVIITLTAAGWSASAPYNQRVLVPGMKAADNPELLLYAPNTLTAAAVRLRQKLTGMITDGVTADGAVTLYCGVKKPGEDFQVTLKGVSGNG